MTSVSSYRLKGFSVKLINRFVSVSIELNQDIYNRLLPAEVNHLSKIIIDKYTIADCISIIISNGDIFDAIKRSEGIELNMNDKLIYHRQLVTPYVREWILNKINVKVFLLKTKKTPHDRTCSICLEEITHATIAITKCKHVFHKCCLNNWKKSTCPMCRANI